MQYTITGDGHRHFEVTDDRRQPAGRLDYGFWRPNKAEIKASDNNVYDIAATGFWGMRMGIVKNGMPFAEIKYGWGMRVTLTFENGRVFYFKKKSFFRNDYMLINDMGQEVALITTSFTWSVFGFDYKVTTHDNSLDADTNCVLPMLLVYCAKFLRMHRAAH